MFGVNWNDPQTLWLNFTNLGLGLVTLACFGVLAYGLFLEVAARIRKPATSLDTAALSPTHAFHTPELGFTMADGGEPEVEPAKPAKAARKPRQKK